MASTDSPLKKLVTAFITDFATWLLGTEVVAATPASIEWPASAEPIKSDQVFHLTLADGRRPILHFEFQGPRSRKPMPLRMLDYMARMTDTYRAFEMYNIVWYVGRGAGKGDTGTHHIRRPDGSIALTWRYDVIRLWELEAETLLALGRPALLALVGQTRMRHPEKTIPEVIARFKAVPDPEQQARLFTAFVELVEDKEVLQMIEHLIEEDEEFSTVGSRYMERLRQRIRAEMQEEVLEELGEAVREGLREEGREEGERRMLRRDILDAVQVRFAPPEAVLQELEAHLAPLQDEHHLRHLFRVALQAAQLADVQAALAQQPPANGAA